MGQVAAEGPGRTIAALLAEADRSADGVGVIVRMHTFSPARMWIGGLSKLRKPLCHLHTQMDRPLPWSTIDMDFMNLHQAAHGDREAGHLHTRMRLDRKVVVGHWSDPDTVRSVDTWARAARAWNDLSGATFARFGDNMRQVAVTEGDKVAAQLRFGFAFDGYGVGDLVDVITTPVVIATTCCGTAHRSSSACAASWTRRPTGLHHQLRGPARAA